MTQWSRFKRYHGYKQDPYWYGEERPKLLTLRRVFSCLTCLLGAGFGELTRTRGKGGKRGSGGRRKYRGGGGGGGYDGYYSGYHRRGGGGDDERLSYRDDIRIGRRKKSSSRFSMYS